MEAFVNNNFFDHNLSLEAVKSCEMAAIAAYKLIGVGDEKAADQLAVDAMRKALNTIDMKGTVVIGEGERDCAPMLYIGEKVGTGSGREVDIALDPLEGTTILATGGQNSLAVLAMAEKGGFLQAPDVYMDKIAIGFNFQEQIIDLNNSPKVNLQNIAKAKKCEISELVVMILNRPRHAELIAQVRASGSKIYLINDGDIAGVVATSMPTSGIDVYMGIGGAPEGVLAAAALCTLGGQMCGRLLFNDEQQKVRARKMGIEDLTRQYMLNDLAKGEIIFAATGVTNGSMVGGVRMLPEGAITHSILMHSSGTIRKIETYHSGSISF